MSSPQQINDEHNNSYAIKIALLQQKVDLLEKDVMNLDTDIKTIRTEMKLGFEKVLDKLEVQRFEVSNTKSFGKGVYWVVAGIVAAVIAFKEVIIALLFK